MTEKTTKRYRVDKNKDFETAVGDDDRIPEPIYNFTKKPEGQVKAAAGLRVREEDSNSVINDYPSESIAKESNSTKKNKEVKLRTTSDKEC